MADQNPSTAAIAGATSAIGLIVALGVDVASLAGYLETSGNAIQHDSAALAGGSTIAGTVSGRSRDASSIAGSTGVSGTVSGLQRPGAMAGVDITGTLDAVQQGNSDALAGSALSAARIRGDLLPQQPNDGRLAGDVATGGAVGAVSRGARLDTVGAVAITGTEAAKGQQGRASISVALLVSGTEAAVQAPNVGRAVGTAASTGIGSLAATQRPNTAALTGDAIAGGMLAGYGLQLARIIGTVGSTGALQATQAAQVGRLLGSLPIVGAEAATQRPNTADIRAMGELYLLIGILLSTQQRNVGDLDGGPIAGATINGRQAPNTDDLDGGPIAGATLAAQQAPNSARLIGSIIGAITGTIAARNVQRAGMVGSPRSVGAIAATQQPNTFAALGDSQYGIDACYLIDEARPLYLIDHIACTCEC